MSDTMSAAPPREEVGPDLIIGAIRKNRRGEIIRVALRTFKNIPLVDVRICFPTESGYLPSGKGVAIRPGALVELISLLRKAETEARARGLITP